MHAMQVRICCKYIKATTQFKNQQTNKAWKKIYIINCKTEYAIYFITSCNLQCVHKNEILFNITLSNHLKEEKHPKAIPADKPFQNSRRRFNKHASG